ncbi:hypothetical protein ANRL3_03062 [Anaerolineae bacterium]|nr:hypothetical protein ANRL3_03062 [Anaerolineae bacterium]
MNTLRVLYHIARADFLERIRRYSFLLMLGLVVWIGYLSASGQFNMSLSPNYLGILNSAWVGGTMTVTVTTTLSLVGFYIVKGSVNRDYITGVGQIMATTPLSRPLYMLGKWLSNFAVLGITIVIMLLAGIVMNLLSGTTGFDLAALAAPLVIIAIPGMGLAAAFAVLFESVSWLRGGLGNVVYFFVFLFGLLGSGSVLTTGLPGTTVNPYIDYTGWQIIGNSVADAARVVYPESAGLFSFRMAEVADPKIFPWNGVSWTTNILLSRLFILAVSVGLMMTSALFFDRFNPSRLLPGKQAKTKSDALRPAIAGEATSVSNVHLTPLTDTRPRFRFGALFSAELKLFLKGQRWWWYAVAVGLVIAQLVTALEVTRTLLLVAWVWPILILSGLGCRENRFDTRQIVFAAQHPIANQLPAAWLSAFVVIAALGFGALIKFVLTGEIISVPGWLTGAVFIPSLALALGILTGSGKAFEVLYVAWMYMLAQKAPPLDFIGLTPDSPWYIYAPVALALLVVAALARQRQLTTKSISK